MKKTAYVLAAVLALALCVPAAQAQVRIVKNAMGKSGLDTSALRADASPAAQTFQRTLQNDLVLSGWFVPARSGGDVRLSGTVSGGVSAARTGSPPEYPSTKTASTGYLTSAELILPAGLRLDSVV